MWSGQDAGKNKFPSPEQTERYNANIIASLNYTISVLRFFVTKELIGMVPEATKYGDVVCVVSGFSFPVVLRPQHNGEYFTLNGPAYVDAYMDGRTAKEVEEGKLLMRTFEIR
jgi:hypothetical protein